MHSLFVRKGIEKNVKSKDYTLAKIYKASHCTIFSLKDINDINVNFVNIKQS